MPSSRPRLPCVLSLVMLVAFAGCDLAGCGDDEAGNQDGDALLPTTVAALDSLADGRAVSLTGHVSDQEADSRDLVLDDGTGLVVVRLPDAPPMLVGERLFVRGVLDRRDESPVVEAVEWLYDSTAVSPHSE